MNFNNQYFKSYNNQYGQYGQNFNNQYGQNKYNKYNKYNVYNPYVNNFNQQNQINQNIETEEGQIIEENSIKLLQEVQKVDCEKIYQEYGNDLMNSKFIIHYRENMIDKTISIHAINVCKKNGSCNNFAKELYSPCKYCIQNNIKDFDNHILIFCPNVKEISYGGAIMSRYQLLN